MIETCAEINLPETEKRVFSEHELKQMRDTIDKMNAPNHIEILRILIKNDEDLNENKYGVHVNLSELSNDTLDKISIYVQYVKSQEKEFSVIEDIKKQYKHDFYDNTDEK